MSVKRKTVVIADASYTLNYNVTKENTCEVVSLTDENGTNHKDQVDPDSLQEQVDQINDELMGVGEEAPSGEEKETPAETTAPQGDEESEEEPASKDQ